MAYPILTIDLVEQIVEKRVQALMGDAVPCSAAVEPETRWTAAHAQVRAALDKTMAAGIALPDDPNSSQLRGLLHAVHTLLETCEHSLRMYDIDARDAELQIRKRAEVAALRQFGQAKPNINIGRVTA